MLIKNIEVELDNGGKMKFSNVDEMDKGLSLAEMLMGDLEKVNIIMDKYPSLTEDDLDIVNGYFDLSLMEDMDSFEELLLICSEKKGKFFNIKDIIMFINKDLSNEELEKVDKFIYIDNRLFISRYKTYDYRSLKSLNWSNLEGVFTYYDEDLNLVHIPLKSFMSIYFSSFFDK